MQSIVSHRVALVSQCATQKTCSVDASVNKHIVDSKIRRKKKSKPNEEKKSWTSIPFMVQSGYCENAHRATSSDLPRFERQQHSNVSNEEISKRWDEQLKKMFIANDQK